MYCAVISHLNFFTRDVKVLKLQILEEFNVHHCAKVVYESFMITAIVNDQKNLEFRKICFISFLAYQVNWSLQSLIVNQLLNDNFNSKVK